MDINIVGGDSMKSGLITKIEKRFLIVKTENNDIERIKPRDNVQLGQRIVFEKKDIYKGFNRISYKQLGASLSILILILISSTYILGPFNSNRIYAVVSVDVNPSINIKINKNGEVVDVTSKSEIDILPEEYLAMNINDFLSVIIGNALDKGYIQENEAILIGYVVLRESKDIGITEFVEKYKKQYQIILLNSYEAYLNRAEENNRTVGRQYLMDLLSENNIVLEPSNTFVQDAVNMLDLQKNDDGYYPLDTNKPDPVFKPIEEQNNSSDTPIEDIQEVADEENTETSIDDTSVDDSPEAEISEVEKTPEELEQIETQKEKVKLAYNNYLNQKSIASKVKLALDNVQSALDLAKDNLNIIQTKITNLTNTENDLIQEQDELTKLMDNEIKPLIADATNTRDASIEAALVNHDEINRLNSEANTIYLDAYSIYKPKADAALAYCIERRDFYINEKENSGATAGTPSDYDPLIEQMATNISIISAQNGYLEQQEDEFYINYNRDYATFDKERSISNSLRNQANQLELEETRALAEAKAIYEQTISSIDEKYVDHFKRQDDILSLLEDAKSFREKLDLSVINYTEEIKIHEAELIQLNAEYQQALRNRNNAYESYLDENALLESLEDEEE